MVRSPAGTRRLDNRRGVPGASARGASRTRQLLAASAGVAACLTLSGISLAAAASSSFTGKRDGHLLVSVRTNPTSSGLYTIEPNGRGLKEAIKGGDQGRFSAHGRQLVFVTYPGPKLEIGIPGKKPFDVSARFRLPAGTYFGGGASLSPDGREIVFQSDNHQPETRDKSAIWLVGANGSGLRKLVNAPPPGNNTGPNPGDPAFSPDGSRIIYANSPYALPGPTPKEAPSSIAAIPVAGGSSTVLYSASNGADLLSPEFSPNGHKILFTDSSASGAAAAWTVGVDGTGARQVAGSHGSFEVLPRWSPDGTQIAFVTDQGTVKVVSASGGSPRTVFTKRGAITSLDW